jgi:hypothetical protein
MAKIASHDIKRIETLTLQPPSRNQPTPDRPLCNRDTPTPPPLRPICARPGQAPIYTDGGRADPFVPACVDCSIVRALPSKPPGNRAQPPSPCTLTCLLEPSTVAAHGDDYRHPPASRLSSSRVILWRKALSIWFIHVFLFSLFTDVDQIELESHLGFEPWPQPLETRGDPVVADSPPHPAIRGLRSMRPRRGCCGSVVAVRDASSRWPTLVDSRYDSTKHPYDLRGLEVWVGVDSRGGDQMPWLEVMPWRALLFSELIQPVLLKLYYFRSQLIFNVMNVFVYVWTFRCWSWH